MTHEDALNLILANACPMTDGETVKVFAVDVHCATFTVTARDRGAGQGYDIIQVTEVKS